MWALVASGSEGTDSIQIIIPLITQFFCWIVKNKDNLFYFIFVNRSSLIPTPIIVHILLINVNM